MTDSSHLPTTTWLADELCQKVAYSIIWQRVSLTFIESFFLYSPVQKFISEERLPHLLFYGPPGTGKTSTILACAKQLYKDKEYNSMVLEVIRNSSLSFSVLWGCNF